MKRGSREERRGEERRGERKGKGNRPPLTGTLEFIGDFPIGPRVLVCCHDDMNCLSYSGVLYHCSFIG